MAKEPICKIWLTQELLNDLAFGIQPLVKLKTGKAEIIVTFKGY